MQHLALLGLFLVMCAPTRGAGILVDLKEQASIVISSHLRGAKVESFGLTQNYSYWTEGHNQTGEYPITAKVLALKCDSPPIVVRRESERPWDCGKVFNWTIDHGLSTPFHLPVNVTIPMIYGSARHKITLDLNNKTQIIVKPKRSQKVRPSSSGNLRPSRGPWVRMVTKTCHFTAPTIFHGWFAVHLSEVRGDYPTWIGLPAGELENKTVGLLKESNVIVAYNVTGQYSQTLCLPASGRPTLTN